MLAAIGFLEMLAVAAIAIVGCGGFVLVVAAAIKTLRK
jgi:hypothetical protein